MKSRENRKIEHIKLALSQNESIIDSGFSQVHVVPNCLPDINLADVSLATSLPGIPKLKHPIIINAITGGAAAVTECNGKLAHIAAVTGSAMAVGSQYGALKTGMHEDSFKIVRKENPNGVLFANTSALTTLEAAQKAVDMLEANALQIHLNVAQELAMEEGDREFSGYLRTIEQVVEKLNVPVIVKETGCGMASAQIKQLMNVGVKVFDIGGAGGTNFPLIEAARYANSNTQLTQWGLPTVISLLEAKKVCSSNEGIVATGGVCTSLDILKALILGANAVGMAKIILTKLLNESEDSAIYEINKLQAQLKDFMVLCGCTRIKQLPKVPVYFTGEVAAARRDLKLE